MFKSSNIFDIMIGMKGTYSETIEISQILDIDATLWFIDSIPYCSVQIWVRKYNCLLVPVHIDILQLTMS